MRWFSWIKRLSFAVTVLCSSAVCSKVEPVAQEHNAFDFSFRFADGAPMPLSHYAGRVVLIVNTASHCAFTPQLQDLQALYDRYQEQGLVVIGVPSMDFNQEFNNNEEVQNFCACRYKVTFPVAHLEHVRGQDAHPFYQYARHYKGIFSIPLWNFHKYLIGRDGQIITWYGSATRPSHPRFIKAVEEALAS